VMPATCSRTAGSVGRSASDARRSPRGLPSGGTPMPRMPRRLNASPGPSALLVLAVAGLLVTSARPAAAGPVGFQATGGWYTNESDFFLGAGARMALGTITAIPNAEWLFVGRGHQYTLNNDGTMSGLPLGVAERHLGAR